MKKRNCRMTGEEKNVHERAVKLRKMTDDKLVEHIDQLDAGECKGIKSATAYKIAEFAREQGYLE